ncbi:MAG: hypothetical protein INR62_02465 [Rhodospirillales bacterium]|nr:hypothetical protein [Acetobacter sp.]
MAANLHWCIVKHISRGEEYARNPAAKRRDDKLAKQFRAKAKAKGFDYEEFRKNFWKTDFALIEIYSKVTEYVGEYARPWQKLPPAARSGLAKRVSESFVLAPLKHANVGELEQIWNIYRAELEEARSKTTATDDDREVFVSYGETKPLAFPEEESEAPQRTMGVAFTVDFSRYSNQEIAKAFQDWLAAHRPARWKTPKHVFLNSPHRGKKPLEYRVALERLGLMRLLHWHSPAEVQRDFPMAWSRYSSKQPSFRREVREARNFFRRLFPFLPKGEAPNHGERKGVWLPPMASFADQVAREMEAEETLYRH